MFLKSCIYVRVLFMYFLCILLLFLFSPTLVFFGLIEVFLLVLVFILILSFSGYELGSPISCIYSFRADAAISACTLTKLWQFLGTLLPALCSPWLGVIADPNCLEKSTSVPQTGLSVCLLQQQPATSSSTSQIPKLAAHWFRPLVVPPEGRLSQPCTSVNSLLSSDRALPFAVMFGSQFWGSVEDSNPPKT